METGKTFYTILCTDKNKALGYDKYIFKVSELPDKRLDHKKMVFNGYFCVCADNPKELNDKLLELYHNEQRVIIDYGDRQTGKSWNEEFDVTGRICRSTGRIPIPILVHNRRSYGGGSILDHCIIGIKSSKGKKDIWKLN